MVVVHCSKADPTTGRKIRKLSCKLDTNHDSSIGFANPKSPTSIWLEYKRHRLAMAPSIALPLRRSYSHQLGGDCSCFQSSPCVRVSEADRLAPLPQIAHEASYEYRTFGVSRIWGESSQVGSQVVCEKKRLGPPRSPVGLLVRSPAATRSMYRMCWLNGSKPYI